MEMIDNPQPDPPAHDAMAALREKLEEANAERKRRGGQPVIEDERHYSDGLLAHLKRSAEVAIQNGQGDEGILTSHAAVLLIDEIQKYRAADAATPSTPVVPRRLEGAIHNAGFRALVLRPTMREASALLDADARWLHESGFGELVRVRPANRTIEFKSSSRIWYFGGDRDFLEDRMRGMLVDHIDGEHLIDHRIAALIKRSGS